MKRITWWVVAAAAVACGGKPKQRQEAPTPEPTAPLPTAGIAGQRVSLLPITLVAAEDSLHWEAHLSDRRASLDRADSIIATLIAGRAPEVNWVLAPELRQITRRAPGVVAAPDQMGTAILRVERMTDVPDPLRSQLRTLVALVGGRYALVPAALVYRRTVGTSDGGTVPSGSPSHDGTATAELAIVLIDVRLGKVGWRTVARGEGTDPWSALTVALKQLTPGLP